MKKQATGSGKAFFSKLGTSCNIQVRRSASFTPPRPELNLSGRYFRCIAPFLWLFPAVHALRHSFILGFHPTFNDVAHFRGILRSRHDTTFRTCRNYCRSALPGSPVLWPLLTSRRSVMHHFLPMCLVHLHRKVRAVLDFALFSKLVRLANALYVLSVRQAGNLPPTSFRFHLAVDTIALS